MFAIDIGFQLPKVHFGIFISIRSIDDWVGNLPACQTSSINDRASPCVGALIPCGLLTVYVALHSSKFMRLPGMSLSIKLVLVDDGG